MISGFLEGYADRHKVFNDALRRNAEVIGMSQLPGARWHLTVRNNIDQTTAQEDFDAVTICVGLNKQSYTPEITGQGFILASKPILQDQFDAGLLVRPFPNSSKMTGIGYNLVMTEGASIRPDVKAFAEWLKGVASSTGQA